MVKKLRLIRENVSDRVSDDNFYPLLILFSVLDTWAYVNDAAYAARLLYNYERIVQRFQQDPRPEHVKANHFWRFCCFLGAWRHTDYLDEPCMRAYEDRMRYLTGRDRHTLWQEYHKLSEVNLNYAIWLLGNCCFDSDELNRTARLEDIRIHDSLFMILDDMVATLATVDTDAAWDVLFSGYRDPRAKALRTFQRLRDAPEDLHRVLERRALDLSHRQLIYDFDTLAP